MNPNAIEFVTDHLKREWEVECGALDGDRLASLVESASSGKTPSFEPTKSGEHINIKQVLEVAVLAVQFISAVIKIIKALTQEKHTPAVVVQVQAQAEAENAKFERLSSEQRRRVVTSILRDSRLPNVLDAWE